MDLDEIRSRLLRAGYPHPAALPATPPIRAVTREAQEARAELREHIIADIWALLDELEALRAQTRDPR